MKVKFKNRLHFELYIELLNKIDPMASWILRYKRQLGHIEFENEFIGVKNETK